MRRDIGLSAARGYRRRYLVRRGVAGPREIGPTGFSRSRGRHVGALQVDPITSADISGKFRNPEEGIPGGPFAVHFYLRIEIE